MKMKYIALSAILALVFMVGGVYIYGIDVATWTSLYKSVTGGIWIAFNVLLIAIYLIVWFTEGIE